ncbi:MAG: tRNA (adenosine(37)-N6)-threonylcarbamoyltransferase complex transferase subunit TsaD [Verrucomicrobiota bacterium]
MKTPILALETSCDETAVAVWDDTRGIVASEISSQIPEHRPYGGVVPELASRNHVVRVRPLIETALEKAGLAIGDMCAFAATAGPGLASSLLIGNTVAKSLALAEEKPFIAVNHLEGHLLSPFIADRQVPPHVALVVSGGHTMLVKVEEVGDYQLLGRTLDDAAGEAFDKVGKMLGLPYPGGPEIEMTAKDGDATAFDFPRSMLDSGDFRFSFSGLKTSVLYTVEDLDKEKRKEWLADVCASFQEAVVEVLVEKTFRAARKQGCRIIGVSGGVSCNGRLRDAFEGGAKRRGLEIRFAERALTTDNAAMIAFTAAKKLAAGETSPLTADVNPNLPLVETG